MTRIKILLSVLGIAWASSSSAIVLNEIKAKAPSGNDFPFEYVELIGDANENVANVYLVGIDGTTGKCILSVNVGAAFSTTGNNLPAAPAKPLILVNGSNGHGTPANTKHITVAGFDTVNTLTPNSAISILLVRKTDPAPITVGVDYDTIGSNDGVFDLEPLRSATVLDAIGWFANSGDKVYPTIFADIRVQLINTASNPDALTRFAGDYTPLSKYAWFGGCLTGNNNSTTYTTVANDRTANFPNAGALTPGAANVPILSIGPIAPQSGVVGDSNPVIPFTVDAASALLAVTATSSDQAVVRNADIIISPSTGLSRSIAINPVGMGTNLISVSISGNVVRTFAYAASLRGGYPNIRFLTGISDASAAVPLAGGFMLVGDDEPPSGISLYSTASSGAPIRQFDFSWRLGLFNDPSHLEADIEGSTRITGTGLDRIYWIGSLGNANNAPFDARPNRDRLFATDIVGTGAATTLNFVGYNAGLRQALINWDINNGHGLGANYYRLAASATPGTTSTPPFNGVEPKDPYGRGFNVEALAVQPGSTTSAYIGFRAPLVPPSPSDPIAVTAGNGLLGPATAGFRTKALVVPVNNLPQLVGGLPSVVAPVFGTPVELNLGLRGIRSMEANSAGTYLIIAGRPDAPDAATNFAIFTWNGVAASAPVEWAADLIGRNPEAIVTTPTSFAPGASFLLAEDRGTADWYGIGKVAKEIPTPVLANWRKFRSQNITLGPPATVTYTMRLLCDTCVSPTDGPFRPPGGGVGTSAEAFGIHRGGYPYVVGQSFDPSFQASWIAGFLFEYESVGSPANTAIELPGLGNPGPTSARGVNNVYSWVGYSRSPVVFNNHASFWSEDFFQDIHPATFVRSEAYQISDLTSANPFPRIVGFASVSSQTVDTDASALYWVDAPPNFTPVVLNGLPTSTYSKAFGVNNVGQMVGSSGTKGGTRRACIWEPDPVTGAYGLPLQLPGLATLANTQEDRAVSINENGTIVGFCTVGGVKHACAWARKDSSFTVYDLGGLAANQPSEARGINNRGQIVGVADLSLGNSRAVSWINGRIFDLNFRTVYTGGPITSANAISDDGTIVGATVYTSIVKAYRLVPN